MRIKINLLAKTDMGSTSTPRPNQRHQQVAWASSTTPVSLIWPNKPYIDFVQKTFALNAFELWRPLAPAPATSGNLWQVRAQLRGAPPSWILGRNGFLWSSQVKLHVLGACGALFPVPASLARGCQRLPELARIAYRPL